MPFLISTLITSMGVAVRVSASSFTVILAGSSTLAGRSIVAVAAPRPLAVKPPGRPPPRPLPPPQVRRPPGRPPGRPPPRPPRPRPPPPGRPDIMYLLSVQVVSG